MVSKQTNWTFEQATGVVTGRLATQGQQAHAYVISRSNELSASGTDLTNELLMWLDIGRKIPTVITVQREKSLENRVLHRQSFAWPLIY